MGLVDYGNNELMAWPQECVGEEKETDVSSVLPSVPFEVEPAPPAVQRTWAEVGSILFFCFLQSNHNFFQAGTKMKIIHSLRIECFIPIRT